MFRDSAAEVAPTSSLTARANTTGSSARGALAALRGVSAGAYAESGAVPLAAIETGVVLATLTTTTPASSCVVLAAVQLCNQDTNTKETLAAGRQPRRAPGRTVRGWPA